MCRDAKWIYDNCSLGTRVDIVSADPLVNRVLPKYQQIKDGIN